jgi:acyl-ACP thioesterase
MDKIGKYHFVTESYLADFRGRIALPMIGNFLLHAASSHAGSRGFGFSEMSEKHTAWVLSRMAIEVSEYPSGTDEITVYTWIDEASRLFTSRCFEVAGSKGKSVAYARSVWAAIDLETRRPIPLDLEALSVYMDDRPCPIERAGKIPPIENTTEGEPYRIKYSDLDINAHFNSIKYIEHFLDMFDLSYFEQKEVNRMEINYLSEGKYGMPLTFHKAEAGKDQYHTAICHEGKAICRAAVKWKTVNH